MMSSIPRKKNLKSNKTGLGSKNLENDEVKKTRIILHFINREGKMLHLLKYNIPVSLICNSI